MANTKLPARLLDTSAVPALNVTGNLTVDTTTLKVDATNNRVGIGIASPAFPLHINSSSTDVAKFQTSGSYTYTRFQNSSKTWALSVGSDFGFYDEAASATRMVIDSSGNVGIGTTSPSSFTGYTNVSIKGGSNGSNLDFHNSSGTRVSAIISNPSTDFIVETNTTIPLLFKTNGSEKMRIDSSGNVGIGTGASPSELLHVKGTNGSIAIDASGASNTASLKFINDNERSRITSAYDTGGGGRLTFHTDTAGGSLVERMRIDNEGNVGIAEGGAIYASRFSVGKPHTHTPGSAFTSSPSSFFSESLLGGTTGNSQKIATFAGSDNSNVSGLSIYRYRRSTGTNWLSDGFSLRQEVDNTSNAYDYINFAGGNVGIGTGNPQRMLTLFDNDQPVFQITNNTSGGQNTRGLIMYQMSGTSVTAIDNQGAGSGGEIRFMAAGTEKLRIDPSASAGHLQMGAFGVTGLNATAAIHGVGNDAALVISNGDLSTSNSSYAFAGRGGRYLTSNGSNWAVDGRDPGLVIGQATATGLRGNGIGIMLHNDTKTDNHYGPMVGWGTKSNSDNYNSMYAYIVGKKTGIGVDTNWNKGELQFDTAGVKPGGINAYMTDTPAMTITEQAYIRKPYQPYIRLQGNSATRVTNHGSTVSAFTNFQVAQGRAITWNAGTGLVTVPITGQYLIQYSFYLWMNNVGHGTTHSVALYHNSTMRQESIHELPDHTPGGSYIFDNTLSNSLILTMNTGDTIRWQVYADIYGGTVHSNASVYLLG